MIDVRIGDARQLIHGLADRSIDCVVTSPPYWSLRDYKTEPIIFDGLQGCDHDFSIEEKQMHNGRGDSQKSAKFSEQENIPDFIIQNGFCSKCGAWKGQLGLEPTPELFIKHLLDFFDDVNLKLKDEGNCFVNLGDTYWGGKGKSGYELPHEAELRKSKGETIQNFYNVPGTRDMRPNDDTHDIIKPKSLCMIPQRFAWGMIEHGWILRNEIIWAKPNHMPESVTDRLTKAHEVIWHFVKQRKYYYDLDAIREPHKQVSKERVNRAISNDHKYIDHPECGGGGGINKPRLNKKTKIPSDQAELFGSPRDKYHRETNSSIGRYDYAGGDYLVVNLNLKGKNPGDVWEITTVGYPESHFAVFPLELVRRPILAGCPVGGTVLDPFAGSGTVGEFCRHNDRNAILFELNPDYKKLIEERAMLKEPELSEWCSLKGGV